MTNAIIRELCAFVALVAFIGACVLLWPLVPA